MVVDDRDCDHCGHRTATRVPPPARGPIEADFDSAGFDLAT